jgi:hypothetical protein
LFALLGHCENSGLKLDFCAKAGMWNLDDFTAKLVSKNPITTMLDIFGNLWCSSENTIFVLNSDTLAIEVRSFKIYGPHTIFTIGEQIRE